MKKFLIVSALVATYISGVYFTTGALLADIDAIGAGEPRFQARNYRSNLGICTTFALFPPFWVASPLMTGFYEHGWQKPSLTNPYEVK